MDFNEQLKIERYRFVTSRASYYADLSNSIFLGYLKTFVVLCLFGFSIHALKKFGNIPEADWVSIYLGTALVNSAAGLAGIMMIIFCSGRRKGFRAAESSINSEVPSNSSNDWFYSGSQVFFILLCLGLGWSFVLSILLEQAE